ncbi:MAG: YraN family protein [Woeseiaceae bacterium]|nr:YraN family protein [Woeseiaceae bacterium]
MARTDTRVVGSGAERTAEQFLTRRGLQPLTRNFRCRLGEIDLVALDDDELVFVEVRYRGPGSFSRAGLTVDVHKQRKLVRTAALYLNRYPRFAMSVMRFDVVAIDVDEHGAETIKWIRDAFRPADSSL